MKISQEQFDKLKKEEKLVISLIGMSNIGKTFWAEKLARLEFLHINCDDLIEAKLAPALRARRYQGIEDVAKWLGQPDEKRSPRNQKKYLRFETEVMKEILRELAIGGQSNIVIDTTGSIVHTGKKICSRLKRLSLIIYLKMSKEMQETMFRKYLQEPKPVIWSNFYRPRQGESPPEALKRCYPRLLAYRQSLYQKLADVILSQKLLETISSGDDFFNLVRKNL